MSLLPLRPLPVDGGHDGTLSIRVDMPPSGLVEVYVRRESDKKKWLCRAQSLLQILVPDQQARQLDLTAVITCLYHGIAYDSTSSTTAPLELHRREIGFTQPETWTDGSYRLSMRVTVKVAGAAVVAMAMSDDDTTSDTGSDATPLASLADEEIVFAFTMVPTMANMSYVHDVPSMRVKRSVTLPILAPAFPHSLLNWSPSPDEAVARVVDDGILLVDNTPNPWPKVTRVISLKIVHAKTPALFVTSIKAVVIYPENSTTYQPIPGGDLYHTIMQFEVGADYGSVLRVTVLPGSSCVLEGSSITIRERVTPAPTKVGVAGTKMVK